MASQAGANEFSLLKSGEDLIEPTESMTKENNDNAYNSEMASRKLRDFKKRSRSNVVTKVAKRIED